jgi:hypothetical protein
MTSNCPLPPDLARQRIMLKFFYIAFGLRIASEMPLRGVHRANGLPQPADVTIRSGAMPISCSGLASGLTVLGRSTAILNIPEVGRYWIKSGREIIVEPSTGVSERNLRLYLLGSAMGAILHQRGILPLHANAIAINGRAVAFSGHSGAGKSTLAAWFHDRGYRLITDDVCAVTFDPDGRPIAQGGLPRLRLREDALIASGRTSVDFELSYDGMDKYDVPTTSCPSGSAVPLAAVYLLGRADDTNGPTHRIQRLMGVEAVDALVANTYRGAFTQQMGTVQQNLAACLTVARAVPVFRAERIWSFQHFDQQAHKLEQHALEMVARVKSGLHTSF